MLGGGQTWEPVKPVRPAAPASRRACRRQLAAGPHSLPPKTPPARPQMATPAHLVAQDAVPAVVPALHHPLQALPLVVAQLAAAAEVGHCGRRGVQRGVGDRLCRPATAEACSAACALAAGTACALAAGSRRRQQPQAAGSRPGPGPERGAPSVASRCGSPPSSGGALKRSKRSMCCCGGGRRAGGWGGGGGGKRQRGGGRGGRLQADSSRGRWRVGVLAGPGAAAHTATQQQRPSPLRPPSLSPRGPLTGSSRSAPSGSQVASAYPSPRHLTRYWGRPWRVRRAITRSTCGLRKTDDDG